MVRWGDITRVVLAVDGVENSIVDETGVLRPTQLRGTSFSFDPSASCRIYIWTPSRLADMVKSHGLIFVEGWNPVEGNT